MLRLAWAADSGMTHGFQAAVVQTTLLWCHYSIGTRVVCCRTENRSDDSIVDNIPYRISAMHVRVERGAAVRISARHAN
jgi:hypothetical protein